MPRNNAPKQHRMNFITLYVGRSNAWDPMCYPRVRQWPLPESEEQKILATYAALPKAAYTSHEDWQEDRRARRLDDIMWDVTLQGEALPKEVFLVMEAEPEECTWRAWDRSEWAPYRLRIDLAWYPPFEGHPHGKRLAFASREEAEQSRLECVRRKPHCRFAIVHIPVKVEVEQTILETEVSNNPA